MRELKRIIVHMSYTPPQMDIGVNEMRKWHTDPPPRGRGWKDIGYHYVDRRSGIIEIGRDINRIGAHTLGHNNDSIGIVMVGGKHPTKDEVEVNFTSAQWRSLERLVKDLMLQYETITDISGHKDNTATKCPGFDVKSWASTL
jgi:N-acetylmuramoyl-L-alanine amidase